MAVSPNMADSPRSARASAGAFEQLDHLGTAWERVITTIDAGRPGLEHTVADARRSPAVPVVILTGFLGAGKTTLLQRLLSNVDGLRIAAVVNDVSSLAFDASAVASHQDDVLSLDNGCSCCSLAGDLGRLLDQRASADAPGSDADRLGSADARQLRPDAIVVELSGIADPVAVAQVVEGVASVRLDGVVAVIDATAVTRQLDHPTLGPTMRRQLDAAHLLVLSKTDLVSETEIAHLNRVMADAAPGRPVVPSVAGDVDPGVLLAAATLGARPTPGASANRHISVAHGVISVGAPLTRVSLARRLDDLPHGVLRVKGWCEVEDGDVVEVQSVGRRWTIGASVTRQGTDIKAHLGVLTVITLDEQQLARATEILTREHPKCHEVTRNVMNPKLRT